MTRPAFHLAFPVTDLERARRFYCEVLGCRTGRESARWIDFDFFGHQLTAHLAQDACAEPVENSVDGDRVPVRHFGVILEWADWSALVERLQQHRTAFLIAPRIRFAGEPGEQATLFIRDPSGNALEFKAFRDEGRVFARE
ncbi:VOC family protein [soil metagenome]